MILPSKTIANLFPIPDVVAFPNLLAPTLSRVKDTTELKMELCSLEHKVEKLERNLGSISKMNRMPSAIFIVDITKEHI